MVVAFSPAEGFVLVPDECPDCDVPLYDTGCAAPNCHGRTCMDCGIGCDIEIASEDGRCATAIAEELPEDALARINEERAAWGLSTFDADGNRVEGSTKRQA